jgi:hypothetical protein
MRQESVVAKIGIISENLPMETVDDHNISASAHRDLKPGTPE